jgi:polyisoprenoid-binding protein YceI
MKRLLLLLLLLTLPVCAAPNRYEVKPVYTSLRFSIVKWGVLKEEGIFRDFDGTLVYDPAHPESARIDVVAKTASLDTKDSSRDQVVTGEDFLDARRYPTIEFHSTGIDHDFVAGDLTIHGTTRRIRFPVTSLGAHEIPSVGRMAGFETTFTINRRDYGVLGTRWGAVPGVLSDMVELHITIGAIMRSSRH